MFNFSAQWPLVVSMSQQMQQLFEAAEWDQLSALQQQRAILLSEIFAHGISAEQRDDIQALLQLNQGLSEKLAQYQQQLSQNFHKVLSSKSGINAYQQVLDHT